MEGSPPGAKGETLHERILFRLVQMSVFFGTRGGRDRFGIGSGRGIWEIEKEGVDVEGKGDGVEGGLVEEGRGEIAEAELLCRRGGGTGSRVVAHWEEVLEGGLGVLAIKGGEEKGKRLTRKTRRGCWDGSLRRARREKAPDWDLEVEGSERSEGGRGKTRSSKA